MSGNSKTCILNVNNGSISTDTAKCLRTVDNQLYERRSHVNVNRTRNQLVYDFLLSDYTYALLLDSDITFLPSYIERLEALMWPHRYIVSGLYGQPNKDIPLLTHPDGTPWLDYPEDEVVECGPTGVGFMLVARSVFEEIKQKRPENDFPWFHETVASHRWVSEDIYFCRQAISCGYKLYTHTGMVCGHVKNGQTYYPMSRQLETA